MSVPTAGWWPQTSTFILAGRAPPRFPPVTAPRQPRAAPCVRTSALSTQHSQRPSGRRETTPAPASPWRASLAQLLSFPSQNAVPGERRFPRLRLLLREAAGASACDRLGRQRYYLLVVLGELQHLSVTGSPLLSASPPGAQSRKELRGQATGGGAEGHRPLPTLCQEASLTRTSLHSRFRGWERKAPSWPCSLGPPTVMTETGKLRLGSPRQSRS